ncbi:hypothetical protein EDD18DRAFT_786290 [Armillaria luteobubalina]|uniref:BTB domain-containing protein n=1 Tax=Armillaria luteobubalina TaxID=153913 RepID=A0AA39QDM9_9AGAR|nr:hypothetical protein EDD18DRAFT_786290 [Armillaria luteobubalina]
MDIDTQPTTADAPFNDPADNVDLVIRTADNVDFFVLGALLSLQSPSSFFGHALKDSQHTEERDGRPVLDVKEDSQTFRDILRFCYPYVAPKIESAKQIQEMGMALDKYCMDHAMERFVQAVRASPVIIEEPLRVFAVAVANGWKEIGEAAARNTLAMPLNQAILDVEELNIITARHLYRLQNYHAQCGKAAQIPAGTGGSFPWLSGKTSGLTFLQRDTTVCQHCKKGLVSVAEVGGTWHYGHPWFNTYFSLVNSRLSLEPRPQIALDNGIIGHAIYSSTVQCCVGPWITSACSLPHSLGEIVAEEIDRRISEVPLDIEWKK